jgi:hypothetical protein
VRRILGFASLLAAQGCLLGPSAFQVNDYRPQTSETPQAYYQCLQGAQQPHAGAQFAAGGGSAYGSASSGIVSNRGLLCACMAADGYALRSITGGEVAVDMAFLPVTIPLALLGAAPSYDACP